MSKEVGLKKQYRGIYLETARGGPPKLEEVMLLAKYFRISIDDFIYRKATVKFEI
jgi:hypothetical protein